MSKTFQYRIPVEILLIISNDPALSDIDIECLRLSCKSFYHSLPSRGLSINPWGNNLSYPSANDYYNFLQRLQRPGNINDPLSKSDNILCRECRTFRPRHRFPIPTLRVENSSVCETCMLEILRHTSIVPANTKHWYKGKEYCTCYQCMKVVEAEWAHAHGCAQPGSYRETWWLCVECHTKICYDAVCGGWPEGWWVAVNEKGEVTQFCKIRGNGGNGGAENEYDCGCEDCMETLASMLQEEEQEKMLAEVYEKEREQCEGMRITEQLKEDEDEYAREHRVEEMDWRTDISAGGDGTHENTATS